MKPKKLDLKHFCIQFTDVLYQRLRLTIVERAVYFYLLRHTRIEGRLQLHCSMPWIARGLGISTGPVRESIRRLAVLGALRIVQRSKAGHILEVRLPDEIPATRPGEIPVDDPASPPLSANLAPFANPRASVDIEKLDFLKTRALRNAIHFRERGHCFYCLKRIDAHTQCLDHVHPRVKAGCNSYRNLVSCCLECNSEKGERSATDFFRQLYRERRITASDFHAGLRRLDALIAGKLPPPVQHPDTPIHDESRVVGTFHRRSLSGVRALTPPLSPHPKTVIPSKAGRLPSSAFVPRTRRPAQSRNLSSPSTILPSPRLIGPRGRPYRPPL